VLDVELCAAMPLTVIASANANAVDIVAM